MEGGQKSQLLFAINNVKFAKKLCMKLKSKKNDLLIVFLLFLVKKSHFADPIDLQGSNSQFRISLILRKMKIFGLVGGVSNEKLVATLLERTR